MATSRKPSSKTKKKSAKPEPSSKTDTAADANEVSGKEPDPLVLTNPDETSSESLETEDAVVLEATPSAGSEGEQTIPKPEVEDAQGEASEPLAPEPSDTGKAQDQVAANETPRPSIFLPLLLGGIVVALLGFAMSQYLGPLGPSTEITELRSRVTGHADEIQRLNAELQSQSTTISEIQSALGDNTAALEDVRRSIAEAPQGDPSLLSDELRATLEEQKSEITRLQGELENMATFAQEQIATAEEEQADAAAAEARVVARGALNVVRDALVTGDPYADALPDIAAAISVPDGLAGPADTGVSSLASLQSGFSGSAREALSASLRETAGTTTGDRLRLFLQDQLGARSLTPRDGDDPDAVLSRAEAAVRAGNLDSAVEIIGQLPESGQQAMSGWISQANERAAAEEAFNELIDGLSEN